MSIFQAIIYGLVQGATEWLPVSSTAHLRIVPALLGWPDAGAAFTAVIQLGTLLAALFYFRNDIVNILFKSRASVDLDSTAYADRRLLLPILVGTLPVCIAGLALKKHIENDFRSLFVVAASMIVFSILLGMAERRKSAHREIGTVTLGDGLLIGLGQMFALIPGASRSGTTITAALALGLERATAARFSFLLSLPAVFLSGFYELYKERHAIGAAHLGVDIVVATVVAFVVGLISIDWFIKFLKSHSTFVFIGYRIVLGIALFALLLTHHLQP